MLIVDDIHGKKEEELSLRYQAERDLLTGAYNRAAAENKINTMLSKRGEDSLAALFLIDLDNFKLINDRMGHAKGDQVLQETVHTLQVCFGDIAIIGRLGGDEFLVFIPESASIEMIHTHAKRLVQSLKSTYTNEDVQITVSASIGIVIAPKSDISFNELYLQADKALYYVKYHDKNGYKIYGE